MTFTASNGIRIGTYQSDRKTYLLGEGKRDGERTEATASEDGIVALREFFRHERDEELGRWRDPATPGYVAYDRGEGYVRVVRETDGTSEVYLRQDVAEPGGLKPAIVARAYFEAHPERKPWHDAKPGEVWVITVDHAGVRAQYDGMIACAVDRGDFVATRGLMRIDVKDAQITAGRRIWPEVS